MLCESTTKISSAQDTDDKQRGRLAASFFIGISTDTGTFEPGSTISVLSAFRIRRLSLGRTATSRGALREHSRTDHLARISHRYRPLGNGFRHHRASAYDSPGADG